MVISGYIPCVLGAGDSKEEVLNGDRLRSGDTALPVVAREAGRVGEPGQVSSVTAQPSHLLFSAENAGLFFCAAELSGNSMLRLLYRTLLR